MNHGIGSLNNGAAAWAHAMLHACGQGGAAMAIAALLSRACLRLSPAARCWLWRAASLKLLAALLGVPSIDLPLLPARPTVYGWRAIEVVGAGRSSFHEAGWAASPAPLAVSPSLALLLVWLLGVLAYAIWLGREVRASRRRLAACRPLLDEGLLDTARDLCRRLRLHRAPRLLAAARGGGPWLEGVRSPAILFPEAVLARCSVGELRLMLAHELAHLKRRDLQWGWLSTAAHGLFFFHPLVWLMGGEWRLAQEMACDEIALQITRAPADEYGRALVKVAAQCGPELRMGPAGVGVLESYHTLKRRLIRMKTAERDAGRRDRASFILAVLGILSLLPWRVVAQEQPMPRRPIALTEARRSEPQRALPRQPQTGRIRAPAAPAHHLQPRPRRAAAGPAGVVPAAAGPRHPVGARGQELLPMRRRAVTGRLAETVPVRPAVPAASSRSREAQPGGLVLLARLPIVGRLFRVDTAVPGAAPAAESRRKAGAPGSAAFPAAEADPARPDALPGAAFNRPPGAAEFLPGTRAADFLPGRGDEKRGADAAARSLAGSRPGVEEYRPGADQSGRRAADATPGRPGISAPVASGIGAADAAPSKPGIAAPGAPGTRAADAATGETGIVAPGAGVIRPGADAAPSRPATEAPGPSRPAAAADPAVGGVGSLRPAESAPAAATAGGAVTTPAGDVGTVRPAGSVPGSPAAESPGAFIPAVTTPARPATEQPRPGDLAGTTPGSLVNEQSRNLVPTPTVPARPAIEAPRLSVPAGAAPGNPAAEERPGALTPAPVQPATGRAADLSLVPAGVPGQPISGTSASLGLPWLPGSSPPAAAGRPSLGLPTSTAPVSPAAGELPGALPSLAPVPPAGGALPATGPVPVSPGVSRSALPAPVSAGRRSGSAVPLRRGDGSAGRPVAGVAATPAVSAGRR